MTLSLRSSFDFADRRAICLAGDRVIVYHWRGGALADSLLFDFSTVSKTSYEWKEDGGVAESFAAAGEGEETALAHFDRYLRAQPDLPTFLLVDIVEEEFRQDTVPHLFGADRRALIERKLARFFRGTPYHHALHQGRETEGRRDDRVLFTALTNPDLLAPLVEVLGRNKVPLAGIYSLPVLSNLLLAKIGATGRNVLLVTLQSASCLRQTFFRDQELKVSRLAKLPRLGTVPYGPYLLGELDKVRRYLNSLRLIAREGPLEVHILSSGDLLADLRQQGVDSEQVRYHLHDIAEVGRRLGISGALTTPYSDALFAHLLLASRPKNHYASSQETRYYDLYRTGIGMKVAGVALLIAAAVWSGSNFIEGVSLRQQALDAAQKADFYEARYQIARQRLPKTSVEANDIKTAVEVVQTVSQYKATPITLLGTLSKVLDGFPALQLDRIEWAATTDANAEIRKAEHAPAGPAPAGGESPPAAGRTEPQVAYRYYQIAELDGHIAPFDGNYREALAVVNRFAETLRGQSDVHKVRILAQPLDISSSASLEGSAGGKGDPHEAIFSVRVVLGVSHEQG